MNRTQEKAIKSLERAFKKCSDCGIVFISNNSDLNGFDYDELNECENMLESEHEEFGVGTICSLIDYVTVETHRTFIDSGGA
jgi:hypothetical protein